MHVSYYNSRVLVLFGQARTSASLASRFIKADWFRVDDDSYLQIPVIMPR